MRVTTSFTIRFMLRHLTSWLRLSPWQLQSASQSRVLPRLGQGIVSQNNSNEIHQDKMIVAIPMSPVITIDPGILLAPCIDAASCSRTQTRRMCHNSVSAIILLTCKMDVAARHLLWIVRRKSQPSKVSQQVILGTDTRALALTHHLFLVLRCDC